MDLVALSALAGNALVTAAVTDAWEDVRQRIARLFGRGRPDPQIERRLDATRRALEGLAPAALGQAQADESRDWQARFSDFLADYPDAAGELSALVTEIGVNASTARDHSAAAGHDMSITASGGSVAAAVIHGSVTPGPTLPGPAST